MSDGVIATDGDEIRQQWQQCFQHTRRGISVVDPQTGILMSVNPAFARMHGGEVSDFVGKPLTSVFTPESAKHIPKLADEVQRTGYIAYDSDHVRLDGSVFPVKTEVMAARDEDGGLLYRIGWYDDMTEQRREAERRAEAEAEQRRSESLLQEAQSVAHIGSWEWDIANDTVTWSDELCRIFGVEPGAFPPSYERYLECIHPDDREKVHAAVQSAYATCAPYGFEHRVRWADGTVRTVDSRGKVIPGRDGRAIRMLGTAQDVTELKRAEEGRREAEERFRRAFEDSAIGMALISVEPKRPGRIIEANDAMSAITGHPREALLAMSFESLVHPDDLPELSEGLRALNNAHVETYQTEHRILAGAGDEQWVALSSSLVRGPEGEPLHRLVQLQDISERKRFEGQLRYLADHDPLTGLFNRRRFAQELERELASARRYGSGGALLVIDLDNFKYMNDSAGHAAGDELIRVVASVLRKKLRSTDYLARLGGDEFAVLLPHASPDDATAVAKGLIEVIRTGVSLVTEHGPQRTSASIGVAPFRDLSQGTGAEEILIEADIAMYDAKEAGRDRFVVFEPDRERQDALEQRLTWSNRIRTALDEERFVLHAQPIVSLHGDAEPRRVELLLRMVDSGGDLIPPATFLYVAERFGLVEEIDSWVVRRAIALVAEHERRGDPLIVDVNLSAKSIGNPAVISLIGRELESAGVDPSRLIFEVTETAAIEQIDRAKEFARGLRALGCGLAIDDFGSGFATFYYLKHLEFDYVKIDGEFIANLPTSATDQLVVRSLVEIAKGLGKKTVAEFVQDDATIEALRRFGVDYAQGFHIGRPGPIEGLKHAELADHTFTVMTSPSSIT